MEDKNCRVRLNIECTLEQRLLIKTLAVRHNKTISNFLLDLIIDKLNEGYLSETIKFMNKKPKEDA